MGSYANVDSRAGAVRFGRRFFQAVFLISRWILSASLPVVSSIDGYLGSVLRNADCGVIYGAEPAALADALRKLASDPKRLAELRENARRIFAERFDANVVYVQFAEYLENLGARNNMGARNK